MGFWVLCPQDVELTGRGLCLAGRPCIWAKCVKILHIHCGHCQIVSCVHNQGKSCENSAYMLQPLLSHVMLWYCMGVVAWSSAVVLYGFGGLEYGACCCLPLVWYWLIWVNLRACKLFVTCKPCPIKLRTHTNKKLSMLKISAALRVQRKSILHLNKLKAFLFIFLLCFMALDHIVDMW